MDIMELGAIGELVGAGAVVASLIYVGLQIRQTTRQMKISSNEGTTRDFRDFIRQALVGGYSKVFSDGLENYESLDERERLDFAFLMFDMFKSFENVYYHYLHGSMGEDAWLAWKRLLASYAVAPGAQHYWSVRRDIFTTEFRKLVDGIEVDADYKRVGHV